MKCSTAASAVILIEVAITATMVRMVNIMRKHVFKFIGKCLVWNIIMSILFGYIKKNLFSQIHVQKLLEVALLFNIQMENIIWKVLQVEGILSREKHVNLKLIR